MHSLYHTRSHNQSEIQLNRIEELAASLQAVQDQYGLWIGELKILQQEVSIQLASLRRELHERDRSKINGKSAL